MRAVLYRLRRVVRSHRAGTLRMGLIVAVVSGTVLAFALGAQRTSSAPDRYVAARGLAADASVTQQQGRPRTEEVGTLPSVTSASSMTFVFGGLSRSGTTEPVDSLVFAGSVRATGAQLVEGREPNDAEPDRFVATRSFLQAQHASLGDRFDLVTLTQEQADGAGFDVTDPAGPSAEAVLVGVIDGPSELNDPTPLALFPPSLLDDPRIGVSATIVAIALRPGDAMSQLRTELDALPDGDTLILEPAVLVDETVRTAISAQAQALWLLTAVVAVAAVAVLGQLTGRLVRRSSAEESQLAAIGFTSTQIVAESTAWAAVVVTVGTLVGGALAIAGSAAFPSGFVRRVEPDPGMRAEPVVLLVGGAGLTLALVLWALVGLLLRGRHRRQPRPSGPLEAVVARAPSATAATGIRFAFVRGSRDVGSPRGAVIGVALTVAVLVGAVTFGSSLGRLVSDPSRSGSDYDLAVGDSGAQTLSPDIRAGLDADPDVDGLMAFATGQARHGRVSVELVGMEPIRGDVGPTALSGRLPAADDEIALGRLEARRQGVEVGDRLTLRAEGRAQAFRVTGLAVVTSVAGVDGVGQGGLVTLAGLQHLDPSAQPMTAVVSIDPRAPAGTRHRLARAYGGETGGGEAGPQLPPAMVNIARVRSIPYVLAAVLAGLVVLTVLHVMLVSVRNRRRDVATVRALGADQAWVTRAVHWQATAFTALPLALGALMGVVSGQLVFRVFADGIGTVDDASIPYRTVGALVLGLLLLANVVARVPARRVRRLGLGAVLHDE